jgi:hypothetical protein
VIGNPDFERRVIVFKRVSSSAVERFFCNSCDLEREIRLRSRSDNVVFGILNAYAHFRIEVYSPLRYAVRAVVIVSSE